MKKIILILLIFSQIESIHASSGRTDNRGCHTSKKEGHHCHKKFNYSNNSNYYSTNNNYSTEDTLIAATALLITAGVVYGIGKLVDSFSSKPTDDINTIQTSKELKTTVNSNNNTESKIETVQITSSKDSKSSIKNNLINIDDSMKNLFGIYIGELINYRNFNKVGNLYEMKNNNNLLGFKKYNVTFKYEKVNSFSTNKDVSIRGCQKEKEALKSILEENFGTQYKIKVSEKSYLLTYPSFISMIYCQDNKLSFLLKGK